MNIYHITYSPPNKTASLYFWGCNLSCRGCIRKKTVLDSHIERCGPPTKDQPHFLSLREVIYALEKVALKRVLFMGGEPTIDPRLRDLAKSIHEELGAYNILLTNGLVLPPLENVDEVCMSIKAFDNSLHLDFTGKSNHKALGNFVAFYRSNVKLRSESIFIPGYIDCDEIEKIAEFIASVDPDIPYRIDGYIPVPGAPWRSPMPQEVEKAASVAKKYLNNVSYLKGDEKRQHKIVEII
jgi:pyruvate-formate lyase-activating enzyme